MSSTKIDTVNTETYLNEGSNSMREMLENHNNIVISSNKINEYKNIETSLFHKSKKKEKKNLFKSTNYAFKKLFRSKHINNEDDIPKKKNKFFDDEKKERSYNKSVEKKKDKSINYYNAKKEVKKNNSLYNKKEGKNINNNNNDNYIGEKIIININNLNFTLNKFKETNNISNFKNEELSDENIYEKAFRLSCIINNSPFISSNIFLKNINCITSIEPLLGSDKCRFFEKNKNI